MPKEAEIKFLVKLDDTGAPEEIYWNATDSGEEGFAPCESLMISMWDKSARNSMSIELWTPRMEVGEMGAHFYHMFMKMADTYKKATSDDNTSDKIKAFALEYAKSVEAIANK
ncbi:MAG: gliding motility protein GldC [Candidatus Dadabacteria bacterium]